MPTDYLEFANVIGLLKPEEIVGLIGEPAKKLDLKMKSSNESNSKFMVLPQP